MRFVFLLLGTTATGALSASAIQHMFPQTAQTFAAVRALGGEVADFKIGDINPVKAYQDVMQKIAAGELGGPIKFPSSPDLKPMSINPELFKPHTIQIDNDKMQRAIASGINSRIQQDIRRAQDMAAYARNPMGWHGVPPH
jgi:hypothetical protein